MVIDRRGAQKFQRLSAAWTDACFNVHLGIKAQFPGCRLAHHKYIQQILNSIACACKSDLHARKKRRVEGCVLHRLSVKSCKCNPSPIRPRRTDLMKPGTEYEGDPRPKTFRTAFSLPVPGFHHDAPRDGRYLHPLQTPRATPRPDRGAGWACRGIYEYQCGALFPR